MVRHDVATDELIATLDIGDQEISRMSGPKSNFMLYADRGEITALILFTDSIRGASVMRVTQKDGEELRARFELDVFDEGAEIVEIRLRKGQTLAQANL